MIWYIFALFAAVFLSAALILEKKSLNKIHALEFSTELSFYSLILSIFLLPWVEWGYSLRAYLIVLLTGIILVFSFLLFNRAIRHGQISEVSPVINLDAISTAFFAFLILYDIPSPWQGLGIGFIIVGSYVLELSPGKGFLSPFLAFIRSKSLILMLSAVTLYGLARVLGKIALEEVSVISLVFFLSVTYFVGYLLLDLKFHPENVRRFRILLKEHGPVVFWTALFFFIYRLAFTAAVALGSVTLATAISRTSTFFNTLAGGKLFGEHSLTRRTIAAFITIIGVLLIVLR